MQYYDGCNNNLKCIAFLLTKRETKAIGLNMKHFQDCTDSVIRCQDRIELTKLKMKRLFNIRS